MSSAFQRPHMSETTSLFDPFLATPARGASLISPSIRSSLLSTLFDNVWPLALSGIASVFVALVAFVRLHEEPWTAVWLAADAGLLAARLGIGRAYLTRSRAGYVHPGPWAIRYAPISLVACLTLGLGTMACVMSSDK